MTDLSRVRVEPLGVELDVLPGETIFDAATRIGYLWPTVCGGKASCKVCTCEVHAGAEMLSPMSRLEQDELVRSFVRTTRNGFPLRLACLAVPESGAQIVVHKRGVRPRSMD